VSEHLDIRVPGRFRYLPAVREMVRLALTREGQHDVDDILLAVQEACVNAVRHGHGGECDRPIHLSLRVDRERVELTVSDGGEGFELPVAIEDALSPTAESGRGLAIIQAIMDEVSVHRADGTTTLSLVKRRRAS
jgi:serine/threonine-protein kinase RsbW